VPPPEPARISTRRRICSGSCASASLAAVMWPAAVLDPALPGTTRLSHYPAVRRDQTNPGRREPNVDQAHSACAD